MTMMCRARKGNKTRKERGNACEDGMARTFHCIKCIAYGQHSVRTKIVFRSTGGAVDTHVHSSNFKEQYLNLFLVKRDKMS